MKSLRLLSLFLALLFCLSACTGTSQNPSETGGESTPFDQGTLPSDETEKAPSNGDSPSVGQSPTVGQSPSVGQSPTGKTPAYNGQPYVTLGKSAFSEELYTTNSFESYAPLDTLGRCGTAFACIGRDIMPTEERGSIGQVKPTGWHTVKYDFVDGKYLYNRCHLIGFQLTGENANTKNLVTGTRSFNVEGMLPFENMVADYVKETQNHVLYRVTPVFENENLVCTGVYIEAFSVEDRGEGIDFNVFCFNVEPGVVIDYATGESRLASSAPTPSPEEEAPEKSETFVLNTNTKKIHKPSCRHVSSIKAENRESFTGTKSSLTSKGYTACGTCKP